MSTRSRLNSAVLGRKGSEGHRSGEGHVAVQSTPPLPLSQGCPASSPVACPPCIPVSWQRPFARTPVGIRSAVPSCACPADNYSEEEYESLSSEQEASDDAAQGQVAWSVPRRWDPRAAWLPQSPAAGPRTLGGGGGVRSPCLGRLGMAPLTALGKLAAQGAVWVAAPVAGWGWGVLGSGTMYVCRTWTRMTSTWGSPRSSGDR